MSVRPRQKFDSTQVLKLSAVGKQMKWLDYVRTNNLFVTLQDQEGIRYLHITDRVKQLYSTLFQGQDSETCL